MVCGFSLAFFLKLPIFQQLNVFPDDSFYYLCPAINLSNGLGPTCDTITLTSGYHPLWMFTLTILSYFFQYDHLVLLNVTICLGMVLHALNTFLLYRIGLRFISAFPALLWSLVFLISFRGLLDAVQGTEVNLLVSCILALIYFDTIKTQKRFYTFIRGILLGLIFLSRTDTLFFILGYLVFRYIVQVNRPQYKLEIKTLLETSIGFVATLIPWFMFSMIYYGTFIQQSFTTKTFWRDRLFSNAAWKEKFIFSLHLFSKWVSTLGHIYPTTILLIPLIIGIGLIVIVKRNTDLPDCKTNDLPQGDELPVITGSLVFYVIGSGLFYSLRFPFLKEWYYGGAILLWPFLGISFCYIMETRAASSLPQAVLRAFIVIFLFIGLFSSSKETLEGFRWMKETTNGPGVFYQASVWIKDHIPKDVKLGAYSSGILSFFSERTITNLDGLANNEILPFTRAKCLSNYLDQKGIHYLVDHESIIKPGVDHTVVDSDYCFLNRLEEIKRFPCSSEYGDIIVWKIRPK